MDKIAISRGGIVFITADHSDEDRPMKTMYNMIDSDNKSYVITNEYGIGDLDDLNSPLWEAVTSFLISL